MAGISSDIRFAVADDSHDAGIRQLLRETPINGDISISMQREPSYFAAVRAEGGEHVAIVAIDSGRVICMGAVSIRERFFNGEARRIGYLGQLRLAASHAGRFDIVRRGYRFFREFLPELDLHTCFTSIAADNLRAAQFLERGVADLPRYEFAGDLVTLLLPASQSTFHGSGARKSAMQIEQGFGESHSAVKELLNRESSKFQFAPAWRNEDLTQLSQNGFRVFSERTGLVGCGGVWDQRSFKQIAVTRYSRRLRIARPFYNLFAVATGRVPLPAGGRPLPLVFVAPWVMPPDRADEWVELLVNLSTSARSAGATTMAIGLDARDPRLPQLLKVFRPRHYRTRLYTVTWPDQPTAPSPDGRLLYPEVALL